MSEHDDSNSLPTPEYIFPAVPNNLNETRQDLQPLTEKSINDPIRKAWLRRNKGRLGVAAFGIAAAASFIHPNNFDAILHDIEDHAPIAATIFPITEGAAWTGAGLMLASAGHKIGNPFTIKKRLGQIRTELSDNRLYRTAWALGAVGAMGTSVTIAVGAVTGLPESSWPIAFGVSAASIAVSTIPFKPIKSNRNESNGGNEA
jgi:hypothetical protein